jgi:hemerythrin-like domain-containing protein
MDVLTKMSLEHGDIYESLAMFKKLSEVAPEDNGSQKAAGLKLFFNDLILTHFSYEEANVLPVVAKFGDEAEKSLVEEIKQEHTAMLGKIRELEALAAGSGFLDKAMDILTLLLRHANKEDLRLYPAFKKYYRV